MPSTNASDKMSNLKHVTNILADALFPPLCFVCGSHIEKEHQAKHTCAPCQKNIPIHKILFYLPNITLAACSSYEQKTPRELIHTLKYKYIKDAITPITELLIKPYLHSLIRLFEKNSLPVPDIYKYDGMVFGEIIICPIPLHKSKLRRRGFNQAELIAKALQQTLKNNVTSSQDVTLNNPLYVTQCSEIGSPNIEHLLIRTKNTDPQAETKSQKERLKNIKDCFKINPSAVRDSKLKIRDSNTIVLVDDVFTSGATIYEAARTLRRAGAKKIIAFVIAKA